MVYQESGDRPNRAEIISSEEAPFSLEESVQRAEEIRERLLSSREMLSAPEVAGEIILSETPAGEIDLRALVGAGERRKKEAEQRKGDLASLYTQSHLLMERASRGIRSEWEIIQAAKRLLAEGYIPDGEGVKGAIAVKTEELKTAWRRIFFPPRFFYEVAPENRSQFFDFVAGELIAVICAPDPTEGFAFENLQEIVSWGIKREFKGDPEVQERARGYAKAIKLSFTTLLRKRAGKENLGQTINHFLEVEKRKGSLYWQLELLEAMTPWQVEIEGEAFVYGRLTVQEFIEGVLNRFLSPRLDWKEIEVPEKKGKKPAIFRRRFSPQAHDILASIVSYSPSVSLAGEETFVFSERSKERAEERLKEMREKGREITDEDLNSLVGQLAVMANASESDLKEFIRRKKAPYPVLAELATRCLSLRSSREKITFLKAVLAARPPDLIPEEIERVERIDLRKSKQLDQQIRLLLQEIAERRESKMKGMKLKPDSVFTIFQVEELFPGLSLVVQKEIVDGYRLATLEGTDSHPLYPLATFLQILIVNKFRGTQASGALRVALKKITDEYVIWMLTRSQ